MSRSHNDRTIAEIREQRCIESNPQYFAKQIRGEAFTEEESVEIATCALPTQEEIQMNQTAGWVTLGVIGPIVLAVIIYGVHECWKADKEHKEAERQWEEARKRHMAEPNRLIAEGLKAKEKEDKRSTK